VADSNHDGRLDFQEFEAYMNQKELELLELFREVDVEKDGKLFPWEIKAALQKAGKLAHSFDVPNRNPEGMAICAGHYLVVGHRSSL
jgi:hypothetical protein